MTNKIISTIALCQKSGNLVSGEQNCEKSIRSKEANLIIVANDASDNTKKKFTNSSKYYHIPLYLFLTKEKLGMITGKAVRSVLVVKNKDFSNTLVELFENIVKNN